MSNIKIESSFYLVYYAQHYNILKSLVTSFWYCYLHILKRQIFSEIYFSNLSLNIKTVNLDYDLNYLKMGKLMVTFLPQANMNVIFQRKFYFDSICFPLLFCELLLPYIAIWINPKEISKTEWYTLVLLIVDIIQNPF